MGSLLQRGQRLFVPFQQGPPHRRNVKSGGARPAQARHPLPQGRIIQQGTLAELRKLLPPATVEYVEKQPSLEEIFLSLVGTRTEKES